MQKLKKIFGIMFLTVVLSIDGIAQNHMFTTNIELSNRGYGIEFGIREKSNRKVNNKYLISFTTLKAPKELAINSFVLANTNLEPGTLKFAKVNQVLQIKTAYGKERTLAKRPDKNSIGLIWSSTGGINFALQTPIYIDYYTPGLNEKDYVTERYNPEIHNRNNIIQSHSYYKGLSGSKFVPSIFVKQGLIMEFGNYSNRPNRIETGFYLDAFLRQPQILFNQKLPSVFLSFYVSFAVLNFEI